MSKGHDCTDCFSLLADKTRLRILRELKVKSANVASITECAGVTQPTVSHHLKMLDDNGFLIKEKKGRETFYKFNENYPCKGCGVFSAPIKMIEKK
ncbi:MAG: metalloregulator ArsR/SmtB family transcription factor [Patescibacteria group bacterium]